MKRSVAVHLFLQLSSLILHPSSFDLVDLARLERATSTFAKSRSISAELQVLQLLIAECGLAGRDK